MRILHAADLHLDSPFRSLSAEDARQRRQDQRRVLTQLRELAQERQVELALFSGDLFDAEQTYPETVALLSRTLGEMPCPVFIAPGNHDHYTQRSPYQTAKWPENVHIFSSDEVECVTLGEKNVEVYGFAFTSPQRTDDPLAGFSAKDSGAVKLGCFHGQVGTQENGYAPIHPDSLSGSGLDYAALGHVHRYDGVHQNGKTTWAYSGCPMGRGFDESGDKGCLIVELENGKTTVEFVALDAPRYEWLEVNVTGKEPERALAEGLAGHENDFCRARLTGQAGELELARLRSRCAGLCRGLQLLDDTVPPEDLWQRAGEENLTGLFLQEMRRKLDTAPEEAQRALNLAVRFGLAALENREFPATEVRE